MVKKKVVKKRTSKKIPKKRTKKKPAKKITKKVRIFKKKEKIMPEVVKALEREVRKPVLGVKEVVKKVEKKPILKPVFRPRFQPKFKPRFPQKRIFPKQDYKSHGERQISQFLKDERIHFLYEYPLAITDEDRKVRIWYPDFWLPELNIIIEYMGMKGKGEYDKANMRKKKIYNALKIDFIEITPGLIVKGNWKRFIAMKIIDIMRSKGYMYNKMKVLSKKYRIPPEQRAKENVGLEILD